MVDDERFTVDRAEAGRGGRGGRRPRERAEPDGGAAAYRWLRFVSIVLAIAAATLFIVVITIGSGGASEVARWFSPVAVAVTGLGLVTAVWALRDGEHRAPPVLALVILAPSIVLSAITVIAWISVGG